MAGTATARKAVPDLTIKSSGKGYVLTDGKFEMVFTPLGNITPERCAEWVNLIRAGLRLAYNQDKDKHSK